MKKTKEHPLSLLEGGDFSKTWLNDVLLNRRVDTLPVVDVLSRVWDGEEPRWERKKVGSSRLLRLLGLETVYKPSQRILKLKGQGEIQVDLASPVQRLIGEVEPICFVDFAKASSKGEDSPAHLQCVSEITSGMKHNGNTYEYCLSSDSLMRANGGLMVLRDFRVPEDYIEKFDKEVPNIEKYIGYLRTLRGSEALLELVTYGGYSHEFTNQWEKVLSGEALSPKEVSIPKLISRAGLSLSNSSPMGRDWKVKRIGKVRFIWNEVTEQALRDACYVTDGIEHKLYSEQEISIFKRRWKEEKLDGQNLVRASKALAELKKLGVSIPPSEIIGTVLQFRWGGVKGTALVVPDNTLDRCRDPKGFPVYLGYDLIVEGNSWKYSISPFYGKSLLLSPEFELVGYSKERHSSQMNYQFWGALDGDIKDPLKSKELVESVIDQFFGKVERVLRDPDFARSELGIYERESPLDSLGVDTYSMTQRTKLGQAIAAYPSIVNDQYWRRKVVESYLPSVEKATKGSIEVGGANRLIISDPIAMLRTDLVDERGDIIISHPSQVGIASPSAAYWGGKECTGILFRSPCIHPGEPQIVEFSRSNGINKEVETSYGPIDVEKLFGSIRDVVVINGFGNALEALGGADTDGDTVLAVTDPRVLRLKNARRKTLLVEIDGGGSDLRVATKRSLRNYMVTSLRDNGIGLITNYATTMRDLISHLILGGELTFEIQKDLEDIKKRALENIRFSDVSLGLSRDGSVEAISKMDLTSKSSVVRALELGLVELRRLQEMAISTPKTGVFVDFGSKDSEVNNRGHLALNTRIWWHKKDATSSIKTSSLMSHVSEYTVLKLEDIKKVAQKGSDALILSGFDSVAYAQIYPHVKSLRAAYGSKIESFKGLKEALFKERFEGLVREMNFILSLLASRFGTDVVAIACYDASNQEIGKGSSFVWNCFFKEFMHTLKFLSREEKGFKLVKIFSSQLSPNLEGTVRVENGRVLLEEGGFSTEIGKCTNVEDGEFSVFSTEDSLYLKAEVRSDTLSAPSTTITGIKLPVIGFKYNGITREGVKEILSGVGSMTLKTSIENVSIDTALDKTRVAVYVRIKSSSEEPNPELRWRKIGVIPFDQKMAMRAIAGKFIRVRFSPESDSSDKENRLTLEITEILGNSN